MAKKSPLTKEALHELAGAGVAAKLADMEKQIAVYFDGWPELFLSETVPQLLKASPKTSSNGHWPAIEFKKRSTAQKASWTPERRAAQAERMRKRQRENVKKKKRSRPGLLVEKVFAYLKKHGESQLHEIVVATHAKESASVLSSMESGLKVGRFQKVGPGRYSLGPKA